MKLITLIALFTVGVASETEVTSAATPSTTLLTTTSSPTIAPIVSQAEDTNRRDGVSYSTSVIHRDPNYPDKDAESSINFRINTNTKEASKNTETVYTTPKYHDYQLSGEYLSHSASAEESPQQDIRQEQGDVVYGQNAVTGPPPSYPSHQSQHYPRQETHLEHSNHQPYYKPIAYIQPTYTETKHKIEVQHPPTQYKHTISTARPRTNPNVRGPIRYHSTQNPHNQQNQNIPHGQHVQHAQHSHVSSVTASHSHHNPPKHAPQAQAYTQVIYQSEAPKSGKSISSFAQSPGSNHGQSQSFNVGYSVKFANDPNAPKKSFKPIRPESDIITGSHKEEVRKPSNMRFPQEEKQFIFAASSPQQVLSEANLTPKTQKQLAILENIQSHKFVQKEPIQSNFPWKNLSPSVEIYRSKEISLPGTQKNSYGFDHDKAIGKSEGFDYSNAVEYMQKVQEAQASQSQAHGYLPEHESQMRMEIQPQIDPHLPYLQISESDHGSTGQIPSLPKLPLDTSLVREPFLTMHQEQINHKDHTLPIHFDTSLIKEVSNGYGSIYADGFAGHIAAKTEPTSHASNFQDSLAQINNLLAEQSQQSSRYQQLAPSGPSAKEGGIFLLQQEQMPVQNPQSKELEMSFGYPQNGLFNPNLQNHLKGGQAQKSTESPHSIKYATHSGTKPIDPQLLKQLKMYKVKEHVHDHTQPQQHKFKVFGKPGNVFMRHQYEKMRHDRPVRMQHGQTNTKRYVRDYTNIEMDLRPPPMTMPFKTTNFLRIKQ